jgi:hypothetical protein
LSLLALGAGALPSCAAGSSSANAGADTSGSGQPSGAGTGAGACECPAGQVCDASGACVGCVDVDDCPVGKWCDPSSHTCLDGCDADDDCTPPEVCNTTTHECVGCTSDAGCEPGSVCGPDGTCVPGCSATQKCPGDLGCCNGACLDLATDTNNCGKCDNVCPALAHAVVACEAGGCVFKQCEPGFADCDKDTKTGCEWDEATSGACLCTPGATTPCYDGPLGTENVGTCKGGLSTCKASGTGWGVCIGQILPDVDTCTDGLDNDCSGGVDDPPDLDGDGWNACAKDCCETTAQCSDPKLVNPGAFEYAGNGLDDDCDGTVDNPLAACDAGLPSNASAATDYAKALDLCASTVESPAKPEDKKWGVIDGSFARADGKGSPHQNSRSIRTGFGSGVKALGGSSLVVLSTGVAAAQTAPNNASPSWAAFQGGQNLGTSSGVPQDWLAANNNNLPNAPGCPEPQGGTTAHDSIQLKLRVRVPTNAVSFTLTTFFYSSEYPEWVCSPWNDFFVALLDSAYSPGPSQPANPKDKNLAFYQANNSTYPVGVNLAFGNTGLFNQCLNGPTGCGGGSIGGATNTCTGTAQLTGTGFDIANPPSQFAGDPGWCGSSNLAGGGTGWLFMKGNVLPGETMELRFAIWDTGDPWYDSVVLLDNFTWSINAAKPGVEE